MALTDPDTDDRPQEAKPVEPVAARRSRLRRVLRVVWATLGWTLVAVGAVLAGAALWIRRTFGAISVDQMLMNAEGGGTDAPSEYLQSFLLSALFLPLLAVALTAFIATVVMRRLRYLRRSYLQTRAAGQPPITRRTAGVRWTAIMKPLAAVTAFAVGLAVFVEVVGIDRYLRSLSTSVTMEDYYVVPDTDEITVKAAQRVDGPKNLVVIFLESGEESFGDQNLFDVDMNEPLEDATADWQRFDKLETYEGGGWTMAGIVGTECGVPLRGPGIGADDINSNAIGAERAEYLPNAVCLGDVLSDAGYTNVFMGGADAAFASKQDFLQTHGYDEIRDYHTWVELGETDMSPWGLSDGRLMEQAKQEVTRLHEDAQPFNLTLLTVDTHEPAFVHDYCPAAAETEDEDDQMAEVVRCSMEQVAGFVGYMDEAGYLDDTAVLIAGDHPKMLGEGGPFYEQLHDLDDRPLFNRLWDPDGAEIQRSSVDQLSLYATLLDVLDLGRSDGRAGVGFSALRGEENGGSALALGADEYSALITSRSSGLYQRLWE